MTIEEQHSLRSARALFDTEIRAMEAVRDALDERFLTILDLIVQCRGKVIITGMGKPGHIGTKIAATMASLGTQSFFLHPAEALHGDLGMVGPEDVVIAISYSGESDEVIRLIPSLKLIGATLVGISGNADSSLIRFSDYSFVFPPFEEACHMHLAPTSSTTVALAFGDALAVCASERYGFNEKNFALLHPAGALGKRLLVRTGDLMHGDADHAVVAPGTALQDAISEMGRKALGILCVAENGSLKGVFTDGDLRRVMSRRVDIYSAVIDDLMTVSPITIQRDVLAVEALRIMNQRNISALPVLEGERLVGTIRINDITGAGIIL